MDSPANGLKLIVIIVAIFAAAAIYGQWQRANRDKVESIKIIPAPAPSAAPSISPNNA